MPLGNGFSIGRSSEIVPIIEDYCRTGSVEDFFDATTVSQGILDGGDQVQRDVDAPTFTIVGIGQLPGGVFVASLASGAVFADAGFEHLGEGAFKSGPEVV